MIFSLHLSKYDKKMKTLFTFLSAITLSAGAIFGQPSNNIVIFNQDGDPFQVILNGVKQNPKPETNVKVVDLTQPTYKVKIIFANKTIPELDKTIDLMWEGENKSGWEFNYCVTKTAKGYKLRDVSAAPFTSQAPAAPGQVIYVYTTGNPMQYAAVSTTTQSTTTQSGDGTGENVNINMDLNGIGMNVNVHDQNGTNTSHTTTTSTTTTTTSSGYESTELHPKEHPAHPAKPDHYIMNGYNGTMGCLWPMQPADFESAKQSIKSKGFDESRLTVAKQIISSNCLLSAQVKELLQIMAFEDSRLELAKFSYGRTFDQGNYYKINDAFQFESTIEELNKYIGGK